MELLITADGDVRAVYDETIDVASLGPIVLERASHVEPDVDARWTADLAPVGGPRLGPFQRRSEALAAERAWLAEHWLVPPFTQ